MTKLLKTAMWTFVLGAALVISACQQEDASLPTGLAGYDPHLIENQEAACIKGGGRFGAGGLSGAYVCYETLKDANQSCETAKDCDGMCLARSRTCSPVKPLFGCHEILSSFGAVSTICID